MLIFIHSIERYTAPTHPPSRFNMNDIEQAIQNALASEGQNEFANKAYLEFIKANFIIPIDKASSEDNPQVLYYPSEHHVFMPAFTNLNYLQHWAHDIQDSIATLHLSGVNLLQGIGDDVTVSLNVGTPIYKEFNPGELARMRSMMIKLGLIK